MFNHTLWGKTINILEKGLDAATLRHQVIADNISNVNTPGFKRKGVLFEKELKEALTRRHRFQTKTTHPKHIKFTSRDPQDVFPKIFTESHTFYRNDLGNVDIDIEMSNLAKNQIMYNAFVERISGGFRLLRTVLKGGGI
ncbi:MAG: flagellar basal body rod protein FlgB [bacterium]|nr:flagellar basal body rod protein FlgB [bacterium]